MESGENTGDDEVKEVSFDEDVKVIEAAYEDGDDVLCGICDPGDGEVGEAQAHRKLRNPYAPSKKEIEEHRILHWPFRSWCRCCMFGRGKHTHHLRNKGEKTDSNVVSISIDFIFIGSKDVPAKKNAILVMYDNDSDAVWAYMTRRKKIPGWLVPAMLQDLNEAGYSKSRLCIRSDQEKVVKKIKTDLIAAREADSVPMESPVRESQCNGRMERMIQTLEGQIRTLLMDLKLNANIDLKPSDVAYKYLVNWACTIITRYRIAAHGKTPFHALTGRQCTRPITAFATPVVWKLSGKPSERLKGETDWGTGVFLGVRWRTSEAMIATDQEVVYCRTMQKDPDHSSVTRGMLESIAVDATELIYSAKDVANDGDADPDQNDEADEADKDNDNVNEDEVANIFGDFDEGELEPNTHENQNHNSADESLDDAETDSNPDPTAMNSVKVDLTQEKLRLEIWDAAMRDTMDRRVELNQVLGKILRGADVTEVYSQPRIAAACAEAGLVGGSSFDLRTGWDLSNPKEQRMATQVIMMESPKLLIGSPPCTLFSNLQNLNLAVQSEEWKSKFYEARRKAEAHLMFCCKLYKLQRSLGRYYLHEHPAHATSWEVDCMKSMQADVGAQRVRADQCQYGLTTWKDGVEGQAKKPTDFLTNAPMIAMELSRRCPGDHAHISLESGRAKAAEKYPPGLVRAIIEGLKNQIAEDESRTVDLKPVSSLQLKKILEEFGCPPHWIDDQHGDTVDDELMQVELNALHVKNGESWAVDDVNGSVLDPEAVKEARRIELEYFRKMQVYTKVSRSLARGKKIIRTRWIDINKGDEANPDMRSRLVGK